MTSELLINSLENVLCSHFSLHEYVLPFLIEQLSEELNLAKIQSTKILVRLGLEECSLDVYRFIPTESSLEDEEHSSILSSMAER